MYCFYNLIHCFQYLIHYILRVCRRKRQTKRRSLSNHQKLACLDRKPNQTWWRRGGRAYAALVNLSSSHHTYRPPPGRLDNNMVTNSAWIVVCRQEFQSQVLSSDGSVLGWLTKLQQLSEHLRLNVQLYTSHGHTYIHHMVIHGHTRIPALHANLGI